MQELVGEQLPEVKLVQHQRWNQAEVIFQSIVRSQAQQSLQAEHRGVDDQQKLDCRRHRARPKCDLSGLILHGGQLAVRQRGLKTAPVIYPPK